MLQTRRLVLVLSVLLIAGCGFLSQSISPSISTQSGPTDATPPAASTPSNTAPPSLTAGPTEDACAQEPLRTYLRTFAPYMAEYEFALIQVFNLTVHYAKPDQFTTAIFQAQSARDSIAALQTPYCAQKMQTALLSSMDHLIAAIKLRVAGDKSGQADAEMKQSQADEKVVESEFAILTAKAGVGAVATVTP